VTKFGLEVLTGKALSVWLEFIDETGEKVFGLQMQIKLKLEESFINKLKTKFNSFFLQNGLKYKENSQLLLTKISQKELNKCLQRFYLSATKRDGRSVIARQNCNR